jgi:hypothetical protein
VREKGEIWEREGSVKIRAWDMVAGGVCCSVAYVAGWGVGCGGYLA